MGRHVPVENAILKEPIEFMEGEVSVILIGQFELTPNNTHNTHMYRHAIATDLKFTVQCIM